MSTLFLLGLLEREAALCSISVAELAHGIYRANTPERRQARRAFLDDLKATVAIYPITADTAELVGKIHGESSQQGITIPHRQGSPFTSPPFLLSDERATHRPDLDGHRNSRAGSAL